MGRVCVEETLLVGAPPDVVYRVLVEPEHRARILPDAYVGYVSEDDSTVSFSLQAGRVKREFRVRTEQTEPERLLREIDLATGIVTEFRLESHVDGTLVTKATTYDTTKSISGFLESLFAPQFLRRLYHEELIKLGRYVLLVGK
ncbi:MAG: SRPBCC family protein [Cyanobacteria bacterium]|nr:SRPBCC family protein [Cyanobacteriota bacterium]